MQCYDNLLKFESVGPYKFVNLVKNFVQKKKWQGGMFEIRGITVGL